MASFLERHFGGEERRRERLAGEARRIDSGYYDIIRFFRFFGADALNPTEVRMEYRSEPFAFADSKIREYAGEVEAEFRRQGRIYDGPSIMHLDHFDHQTSPPRMVVREASYGDHCGSCLALDRPHELFADSGGTLREYYVRQHSAPNRPDWPLASCLGVCGLLAVEAGAAVELLTVMRSSRLASLENSRGVSAAGTVDWSTGYSNLRELLLDALGQEVKEELGLTVDEYTIVPLAFAREIFRGERPQLFALIRTDLDRIRVENRLREQLSSEGEFSSFAFAPLKTPPTDLNHEARLNWLLAEEFLFR